MLAKIVILAVLLIGLSAAEVERNCSRATMNQTIPIKIGLMIPYNTTAMKRTIAYVTTASAVTIALDRIKKENLLPNVEWDIVWHFPDCVESEAAGIATRLYLEDNVDVIIGPPCSIAAVVAGILGKFYNIPLVSWAATDPHLSDRKRFPTMARTIGSSRQLGEGLLELLRHFNWREIALFYNDDGFERKCHYVSSGFDAAVLQSRSKTFSVLVKHRTTIPESSPNNTVIDAFLQVVQTKARIVIACLDDAFDRRRFMLRVRNMGMDTNDYLYILPEYFTDDQARVLWKHPRGDDQDSNDDYARAAFQKALTIEMELKETDELLRFRRLIPDKMQEWPYYYNETKEDNGSIYSPFMHDATYLYALALNKTLENELRCDKNANVTEIKRNGRKIIDNCKSVEFLGVSGKVVTDEFASRQPTFVIKGFITPTNYRSVATVAMFRQQGRRMAIDRDINLKKLWALRAGVQPLDRPKCGWDGGLCDNKLLLILPIVAVFLLILLGILLFAIVRSRSRASRLEKLLWKISREELISTEEKTDKTGRRRHMSREGSVSIDDSSIDTMLVGKCVEDLKANTSSYDFCYYRGSIVAVKHHSVYLTFRSEEDQTEIRAMRTLSHENVNEFLGLCLHAATTWSVWRVCWRGSLQDVLRKNGLKLDWHFKLSLIRDVVEGLDYLFGSLLRVHGSMTSRNCLIDDRYRLKLSEYGLTPLKASTKYKERALFWTAPELLRNVGNNRSSATRESDIYSLGIVISEILTQKRAYRNAGITPQEVTYRVRKGETPPFRPSGTDEDYGIDFDDNHTPVMVRLMRDCWEERADKRPDMRTIKAQLHMLTRGKEKNLMDHVLNLMERYADSLETQIGERTKELMEEKKKSDSLLYRMLPREVADQLKTSGSVDPESYEAVTILFSDVVSFTVIAGRSTPMQVVALLNDLYSLFDAIITRHDAYKIETIGDGLLVVSGLPQRNGDLHATEMADLALELTLAIGTFRCAHRPDHQLQLRVGIHSGPCVAGCVGLSMPRYCLFGDAVNIASRMESHGKAGFIQISEATHQYLSVSDGYNMVSRGEVVVKGKGVMSTYWLLGWNSSKTVDLTTGRRNTQEDPPPYTDVTPLRPLRVSLSMSD